MMCIKKVIKKNPQRGVKLIPLSPIRVNAWEGALKAQNVLQTNDTQSHYLNHTWSTVSHQPLPHQRQNWLQDSRLFITKNTPRTPLFYGLPKVHKPNCSLRPIASANDSPENISSYVNHILQSYMKAVQSFTNDTRHFWHYRPP